jgi:molybdate-binding protein
MVRMALREQGVILGRAHAGVTDLAALAARAPRWSMRQEGAGSQRFLRLVLLEHGVPFESLRVVQTVFSERHAAAAVAQGIVDCAPGVQSAAAEFGLAFLPLGWEAFDLVVPRTVFFLALFQRLLETLRSAEMRALAASLRGYDLSPLGQVVPLDGPR